MADSAKSARDAAAHVGEAVTLFGRAAGTALDRVGQIAGDLLSGLGGGGDGLASHVLPEVRPLFPLDGGAEAATRVQLVNGSSAASEPFTLAPTELVSDAGDRIPADAVTVGAELRVVAAGATDTVSLTVAVPADATPGVYTGELRPSDESVAPVPLVIQVR